MLLKNKFFQLLRCCWIHPNGTKTFYIAEQVWKIILVERLKTNCKINMGLEGIQIIDVVWWLSFCFCCLLKSVFITLSLLYLFDYVIDWAANFLLSAFPSLVILFFLNFSWKICLIYTPPSDKRFQRSNTLFDIRGIFLSETGYPARDVHLAGCQVRP